MVTYACLVEHGNNYLPWLRELLIYNLLSSPFYLVNMIRSINLISFLLALSCTFFSSSLLAQDLYEGLEAHYKFDGNLRDASRPRRGCSARSSLESCRGQAK